MGGYVGLVPGREVFFGNEVGPFREEDSDRGRRVRRGELVSPEQGVSEIEERKHGRAIPQGVRKRA